LVLQLGDKTEKQAKRILSQAGGDIEVALALVQKELDAAEEFAKHVQSICEVTKCDEETARAALTKANGNVDIAVGDILTGGRDDSANFVVDDSSDDGGDWAQVLRTESSCLWLCFWHTIP
jgi:N-acetylmuramic acid 6-phosphate (MurNAc-6-P) etherase